MSNVCKCGHHRSVHVGLSEQSRCTQCHCDTFKLPVTDERQPNTELREKAREFLAKGSKSAFIKLEYLLADFAASALAEAQQQIERLEKGIKAFKEYEECAERQIKGLEEQLAEASAHLYDFHHCNCDFGRAAEEAK